MSIPDDLVAIPGAQQLLDWFGYWPTFHDAEIIRLHLNRSGPSFLFAYTWEITNNVDEEGQFVRTKFVVVELILEGVSDLELFDFSHQNVVGRLDLERKDGKFLLTLSPCYGLTGTIEAEAVSIHLHPGGP